MTSCAGASQVPRWDIIFSLETKIDLLLKSTRRLETIAGIVA